MSTGLELQASIDSIRDNLLNAMIQCDDRSRIGRANEEKAKKVDAELQAMIRARDGLTEAINYVVKIYKNIEQYAHDRKELSLSRLKLAIHKAGYIVPDAGTQGIQLKLADNTAKVISATGQDINYREGSAFRTVMGMLIRYTLLKEQPDAIQAVFLDEAFNTLSDETLVALRECFDAFREDLLILGIEQHNTLFAGLEPLVFRAVKGDDGITTIIKEGR